MARALFGGIFFSTLYNSQAYSVEYSILSRNIFKRFLRQTKCVRSRFPFVLIYEFSNAGFKKVTKKFRIFAKIKILNCKYLFITQDYSGKRFSVDWQFQKDSFELCLVTQIDLDC